MDNSNVYNRYGTVKLPEGYNYNFNITGIAPHQSERYDISGPKRTSGDWGSKDYLIDNLYSSITDDRRLLGRKGDWDENSEEFLNFKKELNDRGLDIYLDSENDNYYKLKRLPAKDPESPEDIPQEEVGNTDDGNDFDWDSTGYGTGDSGKGNRKVVDLYKYLPATLALGRMIGDNEATRKRTEDWLRRLQTPLQSPYRHDRQVYGDYTALKAAENQAAQIRSQMNRPFTSNANLASLRSLEGERLAAEQIAKGRAADNQMLHETYERSNAEQKNNIIEANKVANTNRGLMASVARDKANAIAAADATIHNNLDAWLMNYIEKPIQEEANRRKAYQDYYDYISMGPMEYDFSTDSKVLALKQKAASYRLGQLRKFRYLNPYIVQRVPFDYSSNNIDPGKMSYNVEISKKGGSTDNYPAAVIRAKSKDNDRLIKQILEIIRNHKDLAKGVRMTDYSKYIVK